MAKFNLGMALEDAALDSGDAGQVEDQLELEQGSGETQEQVGEVDELATAVEDAVADIDTLEGIAAPLEESVEPAADGSEGEGVTEQTAEVAEVAVEAIRVRLGLQHATKKPFPALESFGGKSSRVMATKIALEGVMDTIKAAWEAIKRVFKTIKEKIIAFFKSIFDENMRLQSAAKKTIERLREYKSKSLKDDAKVESSALYSALAIGGKVDADAVLANSSEAMKKLIGFDTTFTGIAKALEEAMKKTGEDRLKSIEEVKAPDAIQLSVGPLAGGVTLKTEAGEDSAGHFVTVVEDAPKEKGEGKELEVLPVDKMGKIAEEVYKLTQEIDKVKSSKAGEKFFAAFDKTLDVGLKEALKTAKGDDDKQKDEKEADKKARTKLSATGTAYSKFSSKAAGLAVKGGKAALGYVTASMAQYK